MMLGLDATREEQAYHRRRLTRPQYWINGFGTLAGMRVSMNPATSAEPDDASIRVHLHVSPGIGIDGLGREVMVHETYRIDLRQWIEARSEAELLEGYDGANLLRLQVTVRHKDCPVAQQPVLARKLNLSTDAVQPSRTADSVQLELIPELPPADDDRYQPWASHNRLADALPALTTPETELLTALEASNPEAHAQLSLNARMLHALDSNGIATADAPDEVEDRARLLLARISISLTDIDNLIVHPGFISINNLVRPFLTTASQLARLHRQT
jgi:hypothetical protein